MNEQDLIVESFISLVEYNEVLNNEKANLQEKGFRKGKVPLILINSRYGNKILSSLIEQKTFQEMLKIMNQYKVLDLKTHIDSQKEGWILKLNFKVSPHEDKQENPEETPKTSSDVPEDEINPNN